MKHLIILIVLGISSITVSAQKKSDSEKPKLVVGIVVDQMRDEYLHRFRNKFSSGGFKRMMSEGFTCRNHHYHYASTVTGPGHAHVFTGSSPAISGIVGNDWFEKPIQKKMYVAYDSTVNIVGVGSANAGKMSPRNLKVTTITDQLRIATQYRSKVIGISYKDRGAIMPAGHTGQAYWLDKDGGNWITSTYYRESLPSWVTAFNDKKYTQKYISQKWELLLPESEYIESEGDDQPYEQQITNEPKSVFPHSINMGSLPNTPFVSTLTKDFAIAAIEGENLGGGAETDFLAVSFSGPDYAGHWFGPQSKEVQDVYMRLDRDLEDLFSYLDKKVGKGNYTVFLSADHAVAEIPAYLKKNNIPAGLWVGSELSKMVEKVITDRYGDKKIIRDIENYQVYLNKEVLAQRKLSVDEVAETLRDGLTLQEGVYTVINLADGKVNSIPEYYQKKLTNIYNPKRSGEVMILPEPGWFEGYIKGTTHGTMYSYDTHTPLLLFGWGINHGQTYKTTYISDIAPTVAMLLRILEPSGNIGTPIEEALKK